MLDTNLKGAFTCSKAVMKGMMKKRWGRIINMTSVIGFLGNAGQVNYAAAKAGLVGLTKSMARELAGRNITVNCVAPGYIVTDMTSGLSEDIQEVDQGPNSPGNTGTTGRCRRCSGISGITGQRVHYRPDPACQRRDVHGKLTDALPAARTL